MCHARRRELAVNMGAGWTFSRSGWLCDVTGRSSGLCDVTGRSSGLLCDVIGGSSSLEVLRHWRLWHVTRSSSGLADCMTSLDILQVWLTV